jgi:hypothetical protein
MRIGDKVVCINGDFHPEIAKFFKALPVKDKEYIIRAVRPVAAEGGILLEGLKNDPIFFKLYQGKLEPAFHPNRFRVVEPTKSLEKVEEEELAAA